MNASTKTPALLTVSQAAERLSISVRSLRALIARGDIAVVRVTDRRVAIDEADLAAYVSSRRGRAS